MTVCVRCHRPLKHPTESGMGRVCAAKSAPPVVSAGRDLFGMNLDADIAAAQYRVRTYVEILAAEAHMAVKHGFAAARRRLGLWA